MMMDTTLYNLSHRAQWLKADLDRDEDESPAVDDDVFYGMLVEEQVG
jgi:hypothetical protein